MTTLIAGFDIETTGLEQPEGHRIIEVAAMFYDLDARRHVGNYTTRINPQRGIDPKAQEVHGITYEELIGQPLWEEVAPKLVSLLSKCRYVVAHNGEGFDLPFVYGELIRAGQPLPELGVVDTMLQGRWATPDGAVPNLESLCWACNVPYDRALAHAALYDVQVMMACFFSQFDRGFFKLPTVPFKYTIPKESKK